jgi:EPS-associated MarR family transcriptional regulator
MPWVFPPEGACLDFAWIAGFNVPHRSTAEHENRQVLNDEYRYRILKLLEEKPDASQRDIARELGVSLGRVNYCLQALVATGILKINNFKNNPNKKRYLYLLTPVGMEEKSQVTVRFLKRKLDEYEAIKAEIEELRREAGALSAANEEQQAR